MIRYTDRFGLNFLTIQVLICLAFGAQSLFSQILDSSFAPILSGSGTNAGGVSGIVRRTDGKFVIHGSFLAIGGRRRDGIAVVDQDGTVDPSFDTFQLSTTASQTDVSISRLGLQDDNKVIVAGSFTHINSIAVPRLVRLNADGSLDQSFNVGTGPNNTITTIRVLSDGKILVGGYFTQFNGQAVPPLVKLNPDGSLDPAFLATGNGYTRIINVTLQSDGKILVAGDIEFIFTGNFVGIVRLNADGSVDQSFNPGTGVDLNIGQISMQPDGKILIGGGFHTFNGTPRIGFARLNSDGSVDPGFVCNVNSQFAAFFINVYENGQILLGGSFGMINGTTRLRIARVNSDGSLDASFAPTLEQDSGSDPRYVTAAYIFPDQTLFIGGTFFSVNQLNKFGFAKLENDGSTNPNFSLHTTVVGSSSAPAIQSDGKMIIAGGFNQVNGVLAFGVIRLNTDGTIDPSFSSGSGLHDLEQQQNGYISTAVLQPDGKILIGGNFRLYNGVAKPNLARLNGDGSIDATFPADVFVTSGVYHIVVQPDNKILVAFNGSRGITRFNSDGSVDSGFAAGGAGANDRINRIAIQPDGKIIIVGLFTSFDGTARNRIARLNSNGSLDTGFNSSPGPSSWIFTAAVQSDGKILVGGFFTSFNGIPRNRIARLNTDGTVDTTFNPGTGANSFIESIFVESNGDILIGGAFTSFAGISRNKLARIKPTGSVDLGFGVGLSFIDSTNAPNGAVVASIIETGTSIVTGGSFLRVNNKNLTGLARFSLITQTPTPTATATVAPTPSNTATVTSTPTTTPTLTPTPQERSLQGTITYGNASSGLPPPRFVSNVVISGAGSPAVSTTTGFPNGTYSLSGFGSGAYSVTPSKTGGVNGITSFDAAKVAQHVAGVNLLTGNQLVVADVSGNGTISSFDAGQIARYVAGISGFGSTGNWLFTPANRSYASVTGNVAGEDFVALLMGEVSGNWTNTGAK